MLTSMQQIVTPNIWHPRAKMCAESNIYGVGLCVESELRREYYHEEYPLYYFLGYTYVAVKAVPGMNNKPDALHHRLLLNSHDTHCSVKCGSWNATLFPNLQTLLQQSLPTLTSHPVGLLQHFISENTCRQVRSYYFRGAFVEKITYYYSETWMTLFFFILHFCHDYSSCCFT